MPADIVLILSVLVAGFGLVLLLLNRRLPTVNNASVQVMVQWLKSMQTSIDDTKRTLHEAMRSTNVDINKTLQENTRQLNERLDQASLVIRDVGREVGQMSEIGRGMRDLQEFLKSPKVRGNIGEQVLKDLITQMFPKNTFYLQYQFKTGDRVDAAIKTDAGILTIDAKFPMENFQKMVKSQSEAEREPARKEFVRDIRKHIDAIAAKYILPDEGTMDFALMYLPSEAVFYELIGLPEVTEYARKARVYPVSPSTLYAHLEMILLSFEGRKVELKSRELLRLIHTIQGEHGKIQDSLDTLGRHLTNAEMQFRLVASGMTSLGNKLYGAPIGELERDPREKSDRGR
jgi:DNA recombination protein RmuC